MAKQKNKNYILTRDKYKTIKRYDHSQMEMLCSSIYEDGYKNGFTAGCLHLADKAGESRNEIIEEILAAAAEVKGIGPKKLEEIRARIGVTK